MDERFEDAHGSHHDLADVLRDIVEGARVRTVFQPIVELASSSVIGYEALTRGPMGPLAQPDDLFAAARRYGRLADLDRVCARTAIARAVGLGLTSPATLFVNIEPDALDAHVGRDIAALCANLPSLPNLVLEITERAIAARPAALLAEVTKLREAGWCVALDDVGADDMSLAFMPLLQPDIVKLDLALVQRRPGPAVAQIMNAVNAYAERSGAVILAEGIETAAHEDMARQLGAQLGQGWLYGRPAEEIPPHTGAVINLRHVEHAAPHGSPFSCLPATAPVRVATKDLLVETSKSLERAALRAGEPCVVVSCFQKSDYFTPRTAARYRHLAQRASFVGGVGEGLGPEPASGVRGGSHPHSDVLSREWCVTVLSPHFSAALIARDLGDHGPDAERRFEFVLTYDNEVVTAAAASLMSYINTTSTAGSFAELRARGEQAISGPSATVASRVLDAIDSAVTVCDARQPGLPLIYANPAFERLSGRMSEQILGRDLHFMEGPGSDETVIQQLQQAVQEGREFRGTMTGYSANSTRPRRFQVCLTPVFDGFGEIEVYVGVHQDVTREEDRTQSLADERNRRELAEAALALLSGTSPRRAVSQNTEGSGRSDSTGLVLSGIDAAVEDAVFAVIPARVDRRFELLAHVTKQLLGVSGAAVSLVNAHEQRNPGWAFDAARSEHKRAVPRSESVCRHVVDERADVLITDTSRDARSSFVSTADGGGIMAYAGTPVTGLSGRVVGALCVVDLECREWTADEVTTLRALAEICSAEVQLREVTHHLAAAGRRIDDHQVALTDIDTSIQAVQSFLTDTARPVGPDERLAQHAHLTSLFVALRARIRQTASQLSHG